MKGDFHAALEDFNQAVLINPKDANAFSYRAEAYEKIKLTDQAIADLSQAITLDPNDFRLYCRRCKLLTDKGQLDKAADDASLLINRFPQNPYGNIFQAYVKVVRMKVLLQAAGDRPVDDQEMEHVLASVKEDVERAKALAELSVSLSDRNAQLRGFK